MQVNKNLVENLNCRNVVVVRWDQDDKTALVPSGNAVLQFLKSCGYSTGDTEKIRCTPCPADPEQLIILPMATEVEANRICLDSDTKGFGINNSRIVINRLIGPNGIRIRDIIDCMRIWHEHFDNNELMDVLIGLLGMEVPERAELANCGFRLICAAMGELIEKGTCTVFGSAASPVRRTGNSDIDIAVESRPEGREGTYRLRSVKKLLENPRTIIKEPLSQLEVNMSPPIEVIKLLYRCICENQTLSELFELAYIPARVPLLTFKINQGGMNILFEISINNITGQEKAKLLDLFILKDRSVNNKMRRAMAFILFWAKSNRLLNGIYPEEKLEAKTGFNSYIINHLIIHFVQSFTKKVLVQPRVEGSDRVLEYNFDELFSDYTQFLREFFKYYASFDFATNAIFNNQFLDKNAFKDTRCAAKTPLMLVDPLDMYHNISASVTDDAIKQLNGLIRNALFILKQKDFRVSLLLQTNHTANILMKNKESHMCMTNQLPAALAQFASACSGRQEYLTFQLPDIIQSSAEFMVLLTRILRFDVSPDHEGPSVNSLYNSMGVLFVVHTKSWIGRRNKKRQLKNVKRDTTNLQLEVMCSDLYQYEDEPFAVMRIAMSDLSDSKRKIVYVEMKKGEVADIRDAMHWLIDQFMANNLMELFQDGIMSITDIPTNYPSP